MSSIINISLGGAVSETQPQFVTPNKDYEKLNNEQFLAFSKLFVKDNLMKYSETFSILSSDKIENVNRFFESIPEYLIDFSSLVSKKLLYKYITSNLRYGFGIKLSDSDNTNIYTYLTRLEEIDPRINH